jgi:uncharacterized phage infection (PIP) family protein YhgE
VYRIEEERSPTRTEVFDRTVNSLARLGSQRFAVAPFYEHFDRWLTSVRTILSEFESSGAFTADDQFTKESAQAVSNIELALKERKFKESSREEATREASKNLLDARSLLAQTEREYAAKVKELTSRRERAVGPVAGRVGRLREELNRIAKMRAGFLRRISKKTKAQKEAEASQRLDSTKSQLSAIEQSFATEKDKLHDEYKRRRPQILRQIANCEEEIESLGASSQIDDALEERRAACDALVNAVNALLQRIETTPKPTDSSP